ncbi:MAG: hypothetical protein H6559_14880 [Lewinellaceae bacterium]|nr:hypothetical protein [Lewinellaceae bacterium]
MTENTEGTTRKNRVATDIYFEYWKEWIYPLEEGARQVAFASVLMEVIQSLYGIEAMWELGARMVAHSVEQRAA